MPQSVDLSTPALGQFARDLGSRLYASPHQATEFATKFEGAKAPSAELAETFEVWVLDPPVGLGSADSLGTLARPTDSFHHQIRINGRSETYARSAKSSTSTNLEFLALIASELPVKIDAAIASIDADSQWERSLVRLLSVPSLLVTAFWLTNNRDVDHVFVVESPQGYQGIAENRIYTGGEFLAAAAHERSLKRTPTQPKSP